MKIFLFILSYFFHSYNGETQILCTFQAAFAGNPARKRPPVFACFVEKAEFNLPGGKACEMTSVWP